MSAPWLEWLDGPTPQRVSLERPITIGRTPDNTIQVESPAVSRTHCTVSAAPDGGIHVDARQSANGVRVNGTRVPEAHLRPGQPFEVGGVQFTVGATAPAAAVPTPGAAPTLDWSDGRARRSLPVTGTVTIGRTPENTIQVNAPGVSRRHATVTPTGNAVTVDASGSANGIRVDGTRVGSATVQAGGAFQVGPVAFGVGMGAGRNARKTPNRALVPALSGVAAMLVVGVLVAVVAVLLTRDDDKEPGVISVSIAASEGGVVEMPGGPRVTFPKDSLSQDATITIRPTESAADTADALSAAYEIDSGDAELTSPVGIELPFESDAVDGALTSDTVVLAFRHDSSAAWEQVDSVVDLSRSSVSFQTHHFSQWQVQNRKSGAVTPFVLPYGSDQKEVMYRGAPHGQRNNPDAYCLEDTAVASGLDFGAGDTEFPVLTVAPGRIVDIHLSGTEVTGAGYWVTVEHAGGLQTSYWHLSGRPDHWPRMEINDDVPQGFPVGMAGESGGQTGIHSHIELQRGHTARTPAEPYNGDEVSWHGRTMGDWTFWQHTKSQDGALGYRYQGSATKGSAKVAQIKIAQGAGATKSNCGSGAVTVTAHVGSGFNSGQTQVKSDDCNLTLDASTAIACLSGGTHLGSSNCVRFTTQQVCGDDPDKPEDAPLPNGKWVQAPGNGTSVTNGSLVLLAQAIAPAGSPPVKYVNFTLWWPKWGSEGGPWKVACATFVHGKDNTYQCNLDLTAEKVDLGPFKLSFDVWDEQGRVRKAPGGVLSLDFSATTQTGNDPNADRDGDRIPDTSDQCPTIPENTNNYLDTDGCVDTPPNTDRDRDGIPDSGDQCPDVAETPNSYQDIDGCPDTPPVNDPDPDNDGIPNSRDNCDNSAEDRDNFEDSDGCPEPGPVQDPDPDGDGYPNSRDRECPNSPETFNGYQDGDGCPDEPPVNYSFWFSLNDYADGHTFAIGSVIGFCYELTPGNVPYTLRLSKSSNSGPLEYITAWNDTGGGDCLQVGTVGGPAGPRTYLAEAIVNGAVVAQDTTVIVVGSGGGGQGPGTVEAPEWVHVCYPDSRGVMFWAPVPGSEGFRIWHDGTVIATLSGGSAPGTAFHSYESLPRDLDPDLFFVSTLKGGAESSHTRGSAEPCVG